MSKHTEKHKEENKELAKKKLKRCCDCNRIKRYGLFYARSKGKRSPRCKACEYIKRKPSIDAARDKHYNETYNLTLEEYNRLFEEQAGRCAICQGRSRKNLAVDHNHSNGNVRGLLCQRCNGILAHYRDDPNTIVRILDYLESDGEGVRSILGREVRV